MLEVVAGIKNRLEAASVTGAARTYFVLAESEAPKPYIVVEFVGGGDEHYVTGGMRDEVWQVGVVTGGRDRATASNQARTIQAALKAALNEQQDNISITGWRCEIFWHLTPFWIPDVVAGEPVWYAGGRYRVRLFASS